VSLGHEALDGTKVKANASKYKAMTQKRTVETVRQLEGVMRALLRKAELIDAQEDGQYGKDKRGAELPKEQQPCQDRLDALPNAKEAWAEAADESPPSRAAGLICSGCYRQRQDRCREQSCWALQRSRYWRSAGPTSGRSWAAGWRSAKQVRGL